MSAISAVLQQPAAQAVGWALVHFIWQGALVGVLTALALAALRRGAADVRYVVAAIGLSLMVTMPIVTGMQAWRQAAAPVVTPAAVFRTGDASPAEDARTTAAAAVVAAASDESARAGAASGAGPAVRSGVEPWLPVMVLAWFCGVAVLTLRLLSGWVWVQRMKSHGAVAAEAGWQAMAARLARRLHIRRTIVLLESSLVDVPTVIGWIKPVVLMPASALAGLAPHQLEAILAHELAHIRRHDYLVNLMQSLVETLLFYHPAVWWLSRRIRTEREHCCDDLAVSLCGDPVTYAGALADLEEMVSASAASRAHRRRQLVMAADGGSLLQRVRRLLGAPCHAGREPGWLAGSAAIVVMLSIAAGAVSSETPQAPSAPALSGTAGISITGGIQAPPIPPVPPAPPAPPAPPDVAMTSGFPSLPSLPELPSLPSMPSLPAIPAAPQGMSGTRGQSSGNYSWSHNGARIQINYSGEVEFSGDDTDVSRLSPGGYFQISDGAWFGGHSVEFRADAEGNITRRYWIGPSEKPFDPAGRAWLSTTLPRFVRQSGMGAPARVARILKASGPSGVLAEITLIEGAWAKRIYFQELLKTAALDSALAARLLEQAGRELTSNYELASLLIAGADKLLVDDATRKAYFDAARTIGSDYEMRRVYAAALKKGAVSPALLAGILDASRSIDSDYEAGSLLVQVSELQPLDNATRPAFFAALSTIGSDHEKRRVLAALGRRTDLPRATLEAMIEAGSSLSSDHEAASFLLQAAGRTPIDGSLIAPFFRAVDGLGSAYERGRVLRAVVRQPGLTGDAVMAVLRAARGMSSGYEVSQVLLATAAAVPLSGEARELYVDAAERLGSHEQGQVLAALVRSERRPGR